jgi:V/A-type H+-transporting ATPase subunit E
MDKIQELTSKIYEEGIIKGNQDADRIREEAQAYYDEKIKEAQQEAKQILQQAEEQAAYLSKNTQSELQLFARQAADALKTEIVDLLADKISASSVEKVFESKDFIHTLLLSFVQQMAKDEPMIIKTKNASGFKKYVEDNVREILNNNLIIKEVKGLPTEFVIGPKDDAYKIYFGEEEFLDYFKAFLRPQLVEMFF